MFKKGIIIIFIAVLAMAMGSTCFAAETDKNPNALGKLGAGLINILTGWIELPLSISENCSKEANAGTMITEGILKVG